MVLATMQTGLSSTFHCRTPYKPQAGPAVHHRSTRERKAALNLRPCGDLPKQSFGRAGGPCMWCHMQAPCKDMPGIQRSGWWIYTQVMHAGRPAAAPSIVQACQRTRALSATQQPPVAATIIRHAATSTTGFSRRVEGERQRQGNQEARQSIQKAVRDAQVLPENHQPARGV